MRTALLVVAAASLLGVAACSQDKISQDSGGSTGENAGVDATDAATGPQTGGNQVPATPGEAPATAGETGGLAAGPNASGVVSSPGTLESSQATGATANRPGRSPTTGAPSNSAATPGQAATGVPGGTVNTYQTDPNNTGVAVDTRQIPRGIAQRGAETPGEAGVGSSAPRQPQ